MPPLPATDVPGLRRYPDQPQLRNLPSERGLIGTREEREALVPARAGAIDLPAVEVTWWNTREDYLEHTSLPARTLQINSNPGLAVDMPLTCCLHAPRCWVSACGGAPADNRQSPGPCRPGQARVPCLDGLNGALYSETGKLWLGQDLWRAVRKLPAAERIQDPAGDAGLPPLYPK